MNKARRMGIRSTVGQLEDAKSLLEVFQEEEEVCRDNIPENLQGSERYEASEAACDALSVAVEALEDVIASLSELTEG